MEPPRLGSGGDDEVVGEEEALPHGLPLLVPAAPAAPAADSRQPAPAGGLAGQGEDLDEGSLADKHLVDVEEDVAALDDHPLDGQVLADVLSLAYLAKSRENGDVTKWRTWITTATYLVVTNVSVSFRKATLPMG